MAKQPKVVELLSSPEYSYSPPLSQDPFFGVQNPQSPSDDQEIFVGGSNLGQDMENFDELDSFAPSELEFDGNNSDLFIYFNHLIPYFNNKVDDFIDKYFFIHNCQIDEYSDFAAMKDTYSVSSVSSDFDNTFDTFNTDL